MVTTRNESEWAEREIEESLEDLTLAVEEGRAALEALELAEQSLRIFDVTEAHYELAEAAGHNFEPLNVDADRKARADRARARR